MNDTNKDNQEKWVTAKELAVILNLKVVTIRRLQKAGKIPFHRIGGSVRFLLSEIKETTINEQDV